MTTWMVLGSSPSAPRWCAIGADVCAGAGDSIMLRRPDYYFVNEEKTILQHGAKISQARSLGTKIIVHARLLSWNVPKMIERGELPHGFQFPCDEVIELTGSQWTAYQTWKPGDFITCIAGMFALQFAVARGASEVLLVGMEGYLGKDDYFVDGEETGAGSIKYMEMTYGPFMQRVMDQCPDVRFKMYGKPNYSVRADNLQIVEDAA